jgi:hypothetical protein
MPSFAPRTAFEEMYGWVRIYYHYPISSSFLDRLEVFQYTPPISNISGSFPSHSRTPTLFTTRNTFDTELAVFLSMSPSCLRLVLMPNEIEYPFAFPDFANVSAVISKSKNLRILFLPAFISPCSDNELPQDVKEKTKGLLDVCKEREVEVVWHEEYDNSGSSISPSFRRLAHRLKAEQADAARYGA